MSDQVKLAYSAGTFRVKCEITRAACLANEAPPADLVARAKSKLEAVKVAGEIAFYYIFETRLNDAWRALREMEGEPEDRRVTVTIGAGTPLLAGIKVDKPTVEKSIASLSIDPPKDAAQWRFELFKLMVVKRMREAGVKEAANNAQLYGAFARAQRGERTVAMPISANAAPQQAPGAPPPKPFSVVANKQRYEIGVVIRSVRDLRNKAQRDALLILINQAVKQLSVDGLEYKILKKDFLAALQSACDGVEGLGIDLPLALLAAVATPPAGAQTAAGAKVILGPANFPGAGKITFDISRDKMEAAIAGFDRSYYEDPSFGVTVDWVQAELKRVGLRVEMPDDVIKMLSEQIRGREDLNGRVVLRGYGGVGGRAPYIHLSFKDAAGRVQANLDVDNIDLRELQQRATVKTGQLVAMVKFKEPAVPGRTVFGDEIPAPPDDELIVRVGEGIQQRDGNRFYATCDGIPQIDAESISLSKVLVHNGDVNLRTGNIRFDGPVEIKGSVDSGAVVETSGDLIIHGSVRAGNVKSSGNIVVRGGIVTGSTGRIQAKGDLTSDFIENSTIVCGGNLTVTKALINSKVICGGIIRISAKDGVVAGGLISARDAINTKNLGFKRGALTILNVGVDWRVEQAMQIRKERIEKLKTRGEADRAALRELVQKSKAQTTGRHQAMKEELQERLQHMRVVMEKAEKHLASAVALLTFNTNAKIIVHETLYANVSLTLSGQVITVVNDVAEVAILPKRRRGSFIVSLEELEADDGQKAG